MQPYTTCKQPASTIQSGSPKPLPTEQTSRSSGRVTNMVLSTTAAMTGDIRKDKGSNLDRNPSFFIVGCPRSGLTLLQQLLDAHPLLAVAPEVHWITKHFETRAGLNLEGLLAAEPVAKWLEQK